MRSRWEPTFQVQNPHTVQNGVLELERGGFHVVEKAYLRVLIKIFPPFRGATKNPHRFLFYIPRLSSPTHTEGSTKNLFIFQGFF